MIVALLLLLPLALLNSLSLLVPAVEVLPFGIDAYLVQGIGYLRFIIAVFPPMGAIYNAFLFVLTFKLGLKLFAMIPLVSRILYKP